MREQPLFIEALEEEDLARRAALLDRACAGDAARLVKLRYCGGLSYQDVAEALGLSRGTDRLGALGGA